MASSTRGTRSSAPSSPVMSSSNSGGTTANATAATTSAALADDAKTLSSAVTALPSPPPSSPCMAEGVDASGDATGDASDNASDSVSGSHVGDSDNNSEAAVHADVELKHAHVEREDATAGGTTVTKVIRGEDTGDGASTGSDAGIIKTTDSATPDLDEVQRRQKWVRKEMVALESAFAAMKERYFQQKLREMDEQQCQVFSGDLPAFKQRTDDAWSRHTHALRVAKARYDHRKAQLEREYEAAVLAANGQHCDERWHLRRALVEECERKRVQLEVEMKGEEGGVVVMDANAHVPDVNGADVDKNNGDNDGIGAASAAMVTSSPRPLTADQIDADLFRMNAMVAVADALLLPNGDLLPGYTTPATVIDPKTRQLLASPQFYPTPPSIMAIAPPLPFTVGSRRSSTQQRYSGAEAARTSLPHGQTLVPASAAKSIAPSTRILADLGAEGQEASRLLVTIARSDAEMEARRLRTRVVTVGRGGSGDDAAVASTTPARKKMRVEQTVQRAEGEDVSALFEATAGANATTKEVTATSS